MFNIRLGKLRENIKLDGLILIFENQMFIPYSSEIFNNPIPISK